MKGQPAGSPSPPSPMTTRSGMTLKHIQGVGSRSRRSAAITGEEPSATRGTYHRVSLLISAPPRSCRQAGVSPEEEKFFTEDEYVEEEEDDDDEEDEASSSEKGLKKRGRGRANSEPRMKMRRIFRITHGRERQRGDRRHISYHLLTCKTFRMKCWRESSVCSQRPRRSSDPL